MSYTKPQKQVKTAVDYLLSLATINADELHDEAKDHLSAFVEAGRKLETAPLLTSEQADEFANEINLFQRKTFNWRTRSSITLYLDVIIVALMVAMGIRALFLQPFKIPTGSMQPTLYGIHYIEKNMPTGERVYPNLGAIGNGAIFNALKASYTPNQSVRIALNQVQEVIPESMLPQMMANFIYGVYTRLILVSNDETTEAKILELPGDRHKLKQYLNLTDSHLLPENVDDFGPYKAGEPLADGYVAGGDHLFVDRFSHLFSGFKRGDVVVFSTEGIYRNGRALKKDGYYYIKRLVGLPGDILRIRNHQVEVKTPGSSQFIPIAELSPKFKKIYSFKGGYHGHLGLELLSEGKEYKVPIDSFFVLGDNSRSSLDSRYWGSVPKKNMIGTASFIFWPFSRRFGIADRDENTPDVNSDWNYYTPNIYNRAWSDRPLPAMGLQ